MNNIININLDLIDVDLDSKIEGSFCSNSTKTPITRHCLLEVELLDKVPWDIKYHDLYELDEDFWYE